MSDIITDIINKIRIYACMIYHTTFDFVGKVFGNMISDARVLKAITLLVIGTLIAIAVGIAMYIYNKFVKPLLRR